MPFERKRIQLEENFDLHILAKAMSEHSFACGSVARCPYVFEATSF